MSLRICSISAHFSRWPTPNSGLRIACLTRSSPLPTRFVSRRPLARSASACVSIRLRVSGSIQFVVGQLPQLLVGFEKLQLLVADIERHAVPLAQLLGEPDGVLLGVQDVEQVGRRVDPLAARQIVLDEQPDVHRLRLDARDPWPRTCRRVPTSSASGPPAARMRSPAAGFLKLIVSMPRHSMPTRLTP